MGKSSASPDPSGMYAAMASAQAAQEEYQLGMNQLGFTEQQWQQESPLIQEIANADIANQQAEAPLLAAETTAANQQNAYSGALESNYLKEGLPLVNTFTKQAQSWDTPAQEQLNAGMAEGNVADAMAGQKASAQEQLESFGIDPSSTRYAGLDQAYAAQTGAGEAAAGTSAIMNTKLQGLSLEQAAIGAQQGVSTAGLGASNAASSAVGAQTGALNATTGAGQGASGTLLGGISTESNALTAPTAWYNSGANNMNTYVNAVNGFNYAQNQATSINNQASAGLGSGLGSLFGAVLALDEGGAIPPQASPSGGQAIDDVPARLTTDEFVVPRDVMLWEGQKSMYGMIDKARKAMQQAHARPDIGGQQKQAIPAPPTFVSRPSPTPGGQAVGLAAGGPAGPITPPVTPMTVAEAALPTTLSAPSLPALPNGNYSLGRAGLVPSPTPTGSSTGAMPTGSSTGASGSNSSSSQPVAQLVATQMGLPLSDSSWLAAMHAQTQGQPYAQGNQGGWQNAEVLNDLGVTPSLLSADMAGQAIPVGAL